MAERAVDSNNPLGGIASDEEMEDSNLGGDGESETPITVDAGAPAVDDDPDGAADGETPADAPADDDPVEVKKLWDRLEQAELDHHHADPLKLKLHTLVFVEMIFTLPRARSQKAAYMGLTGHYGIQIFWVYMAMLGCSFAQLYLCTQATSAAIGAGKVEATKIFLFA